MKDYRWKILSPLYSELFFLQILKEIYKQILDFVFYRSYRWHSEVFSSFFFRGLPSAVRERSSRRDFYLGKVLEARPLIRPGRKSWAKIVILITISLHLNIQKSLCKQEIRWNLDSRTNPFRFYLFFWKKTFQGYTYIVKANKRLNA